MTRTKESIKRLLVRGGRSYAERRCDPRVVVLCYHSVHADKTFASVTPERFEAHLAWLKENTTVIPYEDVLAVAGCKGDRPSVAITFDDGYADNYEHAFPLLREYGMPATFFLTSGFIERRPEVLDRFGELRHLPGESIQSLTWAQIDEMRRYGMTIGAHTVSHPNLARLGEAELRRELFDSRSVLEDRLGAPVVHFAYPFGKPRLHFTRTTERLAREAGYETAAAVLYRSVRKDDDPWALPRFFITRDGVAALEDKVCGAWDVLALWQERVPLALARLVSPTDFTY